MGCAQLSWGIARGATPEEWRRCAPVGSAPGRIGASQVSYELAFSGATNTGVVVG
jgi:hypothetical protein